MTSFLFLYGPLGLLVAYFLLWPIIWRYRSYAVRISFLLLILISIPLILVSIGNVLMMLAGCESGGDLSLNCGSTDLEILISYLTFGGGWSSLAVVLSVGAWVLGAALLFILTLAGSVFLWGRQETTQLLRTKGEKRSFVAALVLIAVFLLAPLTFFTDFYSRVPIFPSNNPVTGTCTPDKPSYKLGETIIFRVNLVGGDGNYIIRWAQGKGIEDPGGETFELNTQNWGPGVIQDYLTANVRSGKYKYSFPCEPVTVVE